MLSLLIALSLLVSKNAFAQQVPGLTIRWDAPARCPQQSDVIERVRKLSGSPTPTQVALQADGSITQGEDGRFHLQLVLRSGGLVGERDIDSKSCVDLTRTAAVAIALLLHSDEPLGEGALGGQHASNGGDDSAQPANPSEAAASDGQPSANKPTSWSGAPKQAQVAEPAREPSDNATQPSNHRDLVRLRAPLLALSIGPLPRPDWGVSFAVGGSYRAWRFWLEGAKWLNQAVPSKDFPGYSANVKRATALLRGCRASRFSVFEVAPCLVASLEHVTAVGSGRNVAPESQHVNWIGAGVGAQGRIYLSHWFSLALSVDGILETSRAHLSIGGVGLVEQVAPAALMVTVGPEWIL